MKAENYIAFVAVAGFFLGFVISVLKFDEPEMITVFTIFSMVVFYMIILIGSSIFIQLFDIKTNLLKKQGYDETLDYFVDEFDKREKLSRKIREFVKSLDLSADRDIDVSTNKERA